MDGDIFYADGTPVVIEGLDATINGFSFEKIVAPATKPKTYKYYCPDCGGGVEFGPIPCPDGRVGCLVAHSGFMCVKCGAQWKITRADV